MTEIPLGPENGKETICTLYPRSPPNTNSCAHITRDSLHHRDSLILGPLSPFSLLYFHSPLLEETRQLREQPLHCAAPCYISTGTAIQSYTLPLNARGEGINKLLPRRQEDFKCSTLSLVEDWGEQETLPNYMTPDIPPVFLSLNRGVPPSTFPPSGTRRASITPAAGAGTCTDVCRKETNNLPFDHWKQNRYLSRRPSPFMGERQHVEMRLRPL